MAALLKINEIKLNEAKVYAPYLAKQSINFSCLLDCVHNFAFRFVFACRHLFLALHVESVKDCPLWQQPEDCRSKLRTSFL